MGLELDDLPDPAILEIGIGRRRPRRKGQVPEALDGLLLPLGRRVGGQRSGRAHARELIGEPGCRQLALVVGELDQDFGYADVGPGGEDALVLGDVARRHHVARPHGSQPADLVDAGRAERGDAIEDAVAHHAHHHRAGVEPRGAKAADERPLRRLLVEMHRLRIELAGEGDDLLLRHLLAPAIVGPADLDVLVEELALACNLVPARSRLSLCVVALSS